MSAPCNFIVLGPLPAREVDEWTALTDRCQSLLDLWMSVLPSPRCAMTLGRRIAGIQLGARMLLRAEATRSRWSQAISTVPPFVEWAEHFLYEMPYAEAERWLAAWRANSEPGRVCT